MNGSDETSDFEESNSLFLCKLKVQIFSSFSESVGLGMDGCIYSRIISNRSTFDYGQLFHHKTFVMPYAPTPICCHLETNTAGRTNRVKNNINPK